MDALIHGRLDRAPALIDIVLIGARQAADDWAIGGADLLRDLVCNSTTHRKEIDVGIFKESDAPDRHDFFVRLARGFLGLDGKELGPSIDLFEPFPSVIHTGDVPLGIATLDAGSHTLSITLKGKDPRSTDYLVGMDWIRLTPAPAGSFPDRKDSRNRR